MQPVVECCAPLLDAPLTTADAEQLAGWAVDQAGVTQRLEVVADGGLGLT